MHKSGKEEPLVGRWKEPEPACHLIMFNRSWPSLEGKKPWAARRQLLLCNEGSMLCGSWYLALKEGAKEKSLNLAGRGEDAIPEGLTFLTHFVLSFHFLSIRPRESESCFL